MYIFFDEECLKHNVGAFHPERKERIIPLIEELKKREDLKILKPDLIEESLIEKIHNKKYINEFKNSIGKIPFLHTTDCPLSEGTYSSAFISASGAVSCCKVVMEGKTKFAFSLLRPPGHHARPDQAMGFCYFNNIAIAAAYLIEKWKLKRIAIIDWDAHHGNGTQEIFYETQMVFYTSLHGHPLITYPGTGFSEEKGKGEGEGYTLNFPLFPDVTDEEYLFIFKEKLIPRINDYKPEFLLISCGFDAHVDDPLVPNLKISDIVFEKMFEEVLSFDKVVFILEGGYNPEVVKRLSLILIEKAINY